MEEKRTLSAEHLAKLREGRERALEARREQEVEVKAETPSEWTPETVIGLLELWESQRLVKEVNVKQANMEFGMIDAALRKIGERCARRMVASTQNRCNACGKPFGHQGPLNTVAIYDSQLGNWVNNYSDSDKCTIKLQEIARKHAVDLAAQR